MSWISKQVAGLPAPEVILHIGGGACMELPHWQRAGARRIVLVEPNPELLPELRRRTEGMEQVEIIEAAIAPEAGRGHLRLFNFPLLNSLREPTGLEQVLPGLRLLGQAAVDLLTMQDLLESVGTEEDRDIWLIVDAPGEEAEILDQLERAELLPRFSSIFLTAGAGSFYKNAEPAEKLVWQLQQKAFEVAGPGDIGDIDWPRHHLRYQPLAQECSDLKARLKELQRQLRESEDARAEAEEAHTVELEAVQKELTEVHRTTDEQLQAREKECAKEKATAEELRAQLRSAEEKIQEHKAHADKLQADLSVALRLQQLRENDLKELQSRYGQAVDDKEEQHVLLVQLHRRLSKAAEYLKLAHAEGSAEALPEKLREALVGEEEEFGQPHQDD